MIADAFDKTVEDQRQRDFQAYRARIRRKIMHRITRAVPRAPGDPNSAYYEEKIKPLVRRAVTEVLEEEIKG